MLCYSNTNIQQVWTSHRCKCISWWVMLRLSAQGTGPPNTLQALMTAAAADCDSYQRATDPLPNTTHSHMKRVQTGLGEMIAYLQPFLRMNQQLPWLTSPSRAPLFQLSWIIHYARVKKSFRGGFLLFLVPDRWIFEVVLLCCRALNGS